VQIQPPDDDSCNVELSPAKLPSEPELEIAAPPPSIGTFSGASPLRFLRSGQTSRTEESPSIEPETLAGLMSFLAEPHSKDLEKAVRRAVCRAAERDSLSPQEWSTSNVIDIDAKWNVVDIDGSDFEDDEEIDPDMELDIDRVVHSMADMLNNLPNVAKGEHASTSSQESMRSALFSSKKNEEELDDNGSSKSSQTTKGKDDDIESKSSVDDSNYEFFDYDDVNLESEADSVEADECQASAPEDTEPQWLCSQCGNENLAVRNWCNNCGRARHTPSTVTESSPLSWSPLKSEEQSSSNTCFRNLLAGVPPTQQSTDSSPLHVEEARKTDIFYSTGIHPREGAEKSYWTCPCCDETNKSWRRVCHNCGKPKEPDGFDDTSCKVPDTARTVEGPAKMCPSSAPPQTMVSEEEEEEEESLLHKEVVLLHVYDVFSDETVQAVNTVLQRVGTGAFHAGVEVYGQEWSYGYTPNCTGIVVCTPKANPAHRYRETIVMGSTSLSQIEVTNLLNVMCTEWIGMDYDLLLRNCCHFCDAFCGKLGVGSLPPWVTNLAGAGARFVDGVSSAASKLNGFVDAAAETAAELDKRFNVLKSVDSFTTREITINESYYESKVQNIWSRAVQNMENVGKNIQSAVEGVQNPRKQMEAQISSWGKWSTGAAPQPEALEHSRCSDQGL
jgi:hypothetical protein